jgi:hypothetical protein
MRSDCSLNDVAERPVNDLERIENLILVLLEAKKPPEAHWHATGIRRGVDGARLEIADAGSLLRARPMFPSCIHTLDGRDDGRLYAAGPESLVNHPAEILGSEAEAAIFASAGVKWSGFRRLQKRPDRITTTRPGQHIYYEHHARIIDEQGASEHYAVRLLAFDKRGRFVPCAVNGAAQMVSGQQDYDTAIMACSVIEDAYRSDAFTVSISDGVTLKFPVSYRDALDLFALREAPVTRSGRRRSLAHWVARHLRRKPGADEKTEVAAHWRGVREFVMDGIGISIAPNEVFHPRLRTGESTCC